MPRVQVNYRWESGWWCDPSETPWEGDGLCLRRRHRTKVAAKAEAIRIAKKYGVGAYRVRCAGATTHVVDGDGQEVSLADLTAMP
jgi:hypothetical protein